MLFHVVDFSYTEEVNDEKKASEARVAQLEQHVQTMQAQQQQAPPPATQQPESLTLTVMKELGLDPEDILTGADQARVNDAVLSRMRASSQSENVVNNFVSSKPDYAQVVGHTDPITGQFVTAAPLQRIIANNPSITAALQSAGPSASILAYELASKDPQYMAEVAKAAVPPVVAASEQAAAVIQNANTMASISAVAGQGAIDKAAAIRAMSDEEFEKHKQTVMNQG